MTTDITITIFLVKFTNFNLLPSSSEDIYSGCLLGSFQPAMSPQAEKPWNVKI